MFTVIINSVFQEEQQYYHEGVTLVGVYETLEECKKSIQKNFDEEQNEDNDMELDWDLFNVGQVEMNYTEESGEDNNMNECGYLILS